MVGNQLGLDDLRAMLDLHSALIYLMVITAASDGEMTDAELHAIGENVRYLPVFGGFDPDRLTQVAQDCAAALNAEGGFDATLDAITAAIPANLGETAYALAIEVTIADHDPSPAALRILEIVRQRLAVPGLSAAALQHAARVRHLA